MKQRAEWASGVCVMSYVSLRGGEPAVRCRDSSQARFIRSESFRPPPGDAPRDSPSRGCVAGSRRRSRRRTLRRESIVFGVPRSRRQRRDRRARDFHVLDSSAASATHKRPSSPAADGAAAADLAMSRVFRVPYRAAGCCSGRRGAAAAAYPGDAASGTARKHRASDVWGWWCGRRGTRRTRRRR